MLLTFTELPFVIEIFVLFIFEWPFYTGFIIVLVLLIKYIQGLVFLTNSSHSISIYYNTKGIWKGHSMAS